jgi:hypothetical protein
MQVYLGDVGHALSLKFASLEGFDLSMVRGKSRRLRIEWTNPWSRSEFHVARQDPHAKAVGHECIAGPHASSRLRPE